MRPRALVPFVVALLAIGLGRPGLSVGERGSASPFDGDPLSSRPLTTVLPTLPLDLGTDLSIFGVSSDELATVGPMASMSSSGDNFVVDDNLADCPTATFTSIQAAVNAAPAGAKIRVCRGTYTEQVTIPAGKDGLTLYSTPDLAAVIKAPPVMLDVKAIVRVNGAKNVTIRHFTITGPGGAGCDSIRWGVRVDNNGSALIESNRITLIQDTPFSGCQNAIAVLVGRNAEGQVATAEISHNLIDRYQKGGIVIDNVGSFGNVHHNQIVGPGTQPITAPNGIQISRGANATADHNSVTGNSYGFPLAFAGTGVLLYQAGSNVTIGHNDVFGNDDGISLYTTSGALIEHNNSHDQIFYDGLFADSDTSGNTFSHNKAEDNTEFDCDDISNGGGTAGTDNIWDKNKGETENRPGLCKR